MARQPPTISTSARAASRPGRKCLHRDLSTTTPLGWRSDPDDYSWSRPRPIWSLSAASSSSNDFDAGRSSGRWPERRGGRCATPWGPESRLTSLATRAGHQEVAARNNRSLSSCLCKLIYERVSSGRA